MDFERIQFEITNNCNMKCIFCPNKNITRKKTFIDFDLFKKTIDNIAEHNLTEVISFTGIGEPLLNSDVKKEIEYCKSKELKVWLTTNGLLIEKLDKNILKNVDKLYISWQTFTKETFALREIDYDYNKYEEKILNFIKDNKGINTKIYLSLMLLGTGKLLYKDLLPNIHTLLTKQNNKNLRSKVNKLLGDNIYLNIDGFFDWGGNLGGYSKDFIRIPEYKRDCKIMFAGPMILSDGRVSICCQDFDGNAVVGNLNNSLLSNILLSKKYQNIYNNFKNKKIILNYCQKCKGEWKHKNNFKNFTYKAYSGFNVLKLKLKSKLIKIIN